MSQLELDLVQVERFAVALYLLDMPLFHASRWNVVPERTQDFYRAKARFVLRTVVEEVLNVPE